ncbi:MAG: S46 family peptidase, partial [Bacteroidaceae bacterium]
HRFLNKLAQEMLVASDLYGKSGISAQALPFYAGNKFYLFFKKKYSDVRMVAAPPSSIGKFGGETDNWMWPRHTGDFSVFRIYGDANGEPADYAKTNVPLKSKKHFAISLKGLGEGDYAMVMGFPGSTNRYLTASEIRQEMTSSNEPRIKVREARQNVLREEMKQSDKIRIQYASKFASSSNYWKNAIGMNEAIVENKVIETKQLQEQQFAAFAAAQNNEAYKSVIAKIDAAVAKNAPLQYEWTAYTEAFFTGIEFGFPYKVCELLADAYKAKNDSAIAEHTQTLKDIFAEIHNKDYDHEVDRKVMKTLLPLYKGMVTADKLPEIYDFINKKYKDDFDMFVDDCYDRSIFANEANFNKFINKPTRKAVEKDPMTPYVESKHARLAELRTQFGALNDSLDLLHKIYVRGLGEMKQPSPAYPDANFTLRLTYGNVKSYRPKDGIHYNYFTTMRGIMEKEDPNNREFNVPAKLKELYNNKDFGRYAMKNGEMPVCFTSTNDITGGNSGSPVINARGELIGTAFDGNWESLSGDINFDNDLQRCINVDIRYVLFVIEKLGGCKNLIDEMTIVE